MLIHGKIKHFNYKDRLITMHHHGHERYFHLSNKSMRDFKNYLYALPYVSFEAGEERKRVGEVMAHELLYFIKITSPLRNETKVSYDLNLVQEDIRQLINGLENKLFLDLEFTLPDRGRHTPSEIVQYGFILENAKGQIIHEERGLLRPFSDKALNKATLDFLSLERSDFKQARPYIYFYQLLKKYIQEYNAKIIAWGRNDYLILKKSFRINHLPQLPIRGNYLNIMQVIKTYYNYRQEVGLLYMYNEMSKTTKTLVQLHDALEDAKMERSVFYMFKGEINRN